MSNLSKAGIGLTIIVALIGLVFYFVSAPTILIALEHQDSTRYGGEDIPISIATEDSRWKQWSDVCFRIENQGQSIPSGEIPASNFHIILKTNAICKGCDAFMNYQTLDAQEAESFCQQIKAPIEIDELSFEVAISYDAIIPRSVTTAFICDLTEEGESVNNYKCNIEN